MSSFADDKSPVKSDPVAPGSDALAAVPAAEPEAAPNTQVEETKEEKVKFFPCLVYMLVMFASEVAR